MTQKRADVVVLGLGAMGSASLWQLALRGVDVLGIDQFSPPHDLGSTHGETRITRLAVAEGPALAPLVRRSHELWRDIEARTGAALLDQTGFLVTANAAARAGDSFLADTIAVARSAGVGHELFGPAEASKRFPAMTFADDDECYFEPEGGYVRPEACVEAQLRLAREAGARLSLDTRVASLTPRAGHVEISTDKGTILAGRVVVSAGAWAGQLLGEELFTLLQPAREVLHWFASKPALAPAWEASPVYFRSMGPAETDTFYGFPGRGGEVKVALHRSKLPRIAPDGYDRETDEDASRAFHAQLLAGRLLGLDPETTRRKTCLYTLTPDAQFVIDDWPRDARVLVVSPCSGHGFKHSAAIGESVAQRVLDGASAIDLSSFALKRFAS